jgi:CelD/BcsL family acetyltransferase involved in cellulose biosynthesis
LVVQESSSLAAFRALEPEWRALERESGHPFASYDWAFAWWNQLREDKLGVKDALSLRTMRTPTGRLVAVAPMLISRRPSFGPLCVRQLQFFGADPNITELRGVVSLPEWRAEAYRALVDDALDHKHDWDCLLLSGVPLDADLGEAAALPDFKWLGQTADYQLALPESWDTFRAGLPRNIKESLRKCYNSLKRDGLAFSLQVATTPEEVAPALERFYELHAARSRLAGAVHHWDVFRAPEARGFLNDVCQRFAERGCLRIFQLVISGQVVAVRIGFVAAGTLYLYYSGYDPAFADYSVMTTTVAEAIKYAIEQGFSRVNLSTGNDVSKTRWNPIEHVTRYALLSSPSMRSKLTQQVYRHALSAIDTSPALRRATTFLARRSLPPPPPVPR